MIEIKTAKVIPDIDMAAIFFVTGLVLNGRAASVTLANDLILEYWPPLTNDLPHRLKAKRYTKIGVPSERDQAVVMNAIMAMMKNFGIEGLLIDWESSNADNWGVTSFSWGPVA